MQVFVDGFMHNDGFWCGWLGSVPLGFGAIQARFKGGVELEVLGCFVQLVAPVLIAESHQPSCAQRFFRATTLSTVTSSCTQLLLRIGSKVRISLPAAARIAMTARVEGSMKYWNLAKV